MKQLGTNLPTIYKIIYKYIGRDDRAFQNIQTSFYRPREDKLVQITASRVTFFAMAQVRIAAKMVVKLNNISDGKLTGN